MMRENAPENVIFLEILIRILINLQNFKESFEMNWLNLEQICNMTERTSVYLNHLLHSLAS